MPNQPQPTLPAPTPFSDMERAYIQDQPANLFPPNQDSNFGTYRKILCDTLQDVADQIELLLNENFVATSTQFLNYHEEEVGLPTLTSASIQYRQQRVLSRLKKGLFSRTRRNTIIESFIFATGGTPTAIRTGIAIGAGLTLYSGVSGNPKTFYRVTEDIPSFHYTVYIDSAAQVDTQSLAVELSRVTPGGLGFTVTAVTNLPTATKAPSPALYWRLNEATGALTVADSSGNNRAGTPGSGVSFGQTQSMDTKTSALFNNSLTAYIVANTYQPFALSSQRTFMGWAYRSAYTDQDDLFASDARGGLLRLASGTNDVTFYPDSGAAGSGLWTNAWPGNGQWAHWALTYNDSTKVAELFINGVSKGTRTIANGYFTTVTAHFEVGSSSQGWDGFMQEVAVFPSVLTLAQIQSIYNAGVAGVG